MRLMLVGADSPYAIENPYVKYLRQEGIEVNHFCAQNLFYDYYNAGLLHKVLFRAGLSSIYGQINRLFMEEVTKFKPDIIWVFKGMEITPASLRWAKARNIILVCYNPDNPFIFSGRGSGNKNVTDSIGLYDFHFTYNIAIKKQLEEQFQAKTSLLPFGFDIDESTLQRCHQQEEVIKVCFVGNPDAQRAALIKELVAQGIEIDLYGSNWQKFVDGKGVKCFAPVYGADLWMTLYRYRVQLNFMRIHNPDSHNMRTFEVPGVGGIALMPGTTEHELFFVHGKEVYLYVDINNAARLAKSILSLPAAAAATVRQNARQKCLDAGYSYQQRAKQALVAMKSLLDTHA